MTGLRRDDGGQITTAFVIVGTVLVVALGVGVTKLGMATDQKSRVQIAADAAALAGAQEIRKDVPGLIVDAILHGGGDPFTNGPACMVGQPQANAFATRGESLLVSYCYHPERDTVEVSVDSVNNSVSGSPAHATAESRVGLTVGNCVNPSTPQPPSPPPSTPPMTPAPADPPPTTTAPDVQREMHCGDVTIKITFDGETGQIKKDLLESQIRDQFTPALRS